MMLLLTYYNLLYLVYKYQILSLSKSSNPIQNYHNQFIQILLLIKKFKSDKNYLNYFNYSI